MNKLDKMVIEKITEMYNPNDLAYQSTEYVKKLSSVRNVNNLDDSEPETDVIQELKQAMIENDDEIHLDFEDGEDIKVDINIIKYMFANYSEEQILICLQSKESFHEMMEDLFDVIYMDDEFEDEEDDND